MYWYDTVPNVRPSIVQFTWWLKLGTFNGICTIVALLACTDAFPHCYSQWGEKGGVVTGGEIHFPMTFQHYCRSVSCIHAGTNPAAGCVINQITTSEFAVYHALANGTNYLWFAMGY